MRFSMTRKIKSVDAVTQGHKPVDQVHVSPAMFGEPVYHQQYGFDRPFGKPALIINLVIPVFVQKPFFMLHVASLIF